MADGNGFIKVNDKLPEDGSIIDKDTICVCSGTFRASSAMDGRNVLHPIPLASSNGCSTTTTNFKLVVQGMMKEDGTLELEFSDNFGQSYYTNEKVCPKSYIGQKLPDDIVDRGRALALFPEAGGLQYKGGVLIWYMPLGFWFFSFVTAASIGATFHKPSHFKRNW